MSLEKPAAVGDNGLGEAVRTLIRSQAVSWPGFARGLAGLGRARERVFDVDGFPIVARHLPHRIASTTAPVDAESVSARPCFLCPENRPAEQRGIPAGEFEIFCNPFPILEEHMTIGCREHVPQRLYRADPSRGIGRMLEFARGLPGLMVLYNGPLSGASAPDHLHFQAASASRVPVFDGGIEIDDGVIGRYPGSGIAISGADPERVGGSLFRMIDRLPQLPSIGEPMLNLAAVYRAGLWHARLFPRARHRPGVYERGEFVWSPGSIDMCGVAVLPAPGDLERLTVDVIRETYREVSVPLAEARRVAGRIDPTDSEDAAT